jgi:hypothetical protein
MLTPIVTDAGRELEDLTIEIFSTTYLCDWRQAWLMAWAQMPELRAYAEAWDAAIGDFQAAASEQQVAA